MTKGQSQLYRLVLSAFKGKMSEFGFLPDQAQYFVRAIEDGKMSFHLRLIRSVEGLHIAADVGIRFNEVETLRNRFEGMSITKSEHTWTLACEFGSLLGNGLESGRSEARRT